MPKLPSGLNTFEASDIVRRIAQNENIEAIDALFHEAQGHRHTGKGGDAPQIGKEGIATGAVVTEKLANATVTADKIAGGAVLADKLAAGAVTGDKIAAGAVNTNKIVTGAVTADKIAGGAILTDKLAAGAVTGDKIASAAVSTDKIAANAVNTDKIATGAVTSGKISKNSLDRQHLRQGGLSSNIAKFKRVSVTAGTLTGNPTTPFTFQWGSVGDSHLWTLPKEVVLPQSLTIYLGKEYVRLEGMSFGSWVGSDLSRMPRGFYAEVSANGTDWTRVYSQTGTVNEPFTFLPFNPVTNGQYVRLTITEASVSLENVISCLAVYSSYHGNVDLDPLEDERSWGLNARLQGLMIIPEGQIRDYGGGQLGIYKSLIVMNPGSGTYFRVNPGTYELPDWGYLYVDIPHVNAQSITPKIGKWLEGSRGYDNKDRIVIAQRNANEDIFMNSAIQAKIAGILPNADKVDGIDFQTKNGYLEFDDGTGWKNVAAVKKVQRGYVALYNDGTWSDGERFVLTMNAVNIEKSFLNVSSTGSTNGSPKYNAGVRGRILNATQFEVVTIFSPLFDQRISWEVIEFV
ncbi:hypothetical protein DFP94_11289 [Fontibacillus phaseoli]|uniref:F5/8 type C domain-containing protein n=1 Tax=Fontibacillus phaseoli TaxID=1416533 RepID=A0A369B4L8_9BACL|nr:discoidin domain-containing protein [Fontibacillus phaseoli]RCX16469.1 hypothetical protein DFP94_11289 [Fontibacillus phaseoli]